jgi:ParB/RepB/Spo0J family partition protein
MSEPATAVLDIDQIATEEGFNPRTRFDEESLAELEASIREHGVVQAPTVRPAEDGHYTVIAGERRLIAAKRAGVTRIPVLIRNEADGARAAALAENLIREDLDPIDTARALHDLSQAEGLNTHAKIAERVKKSPSWVSDHLRLLKLPEGVQRHVAEGHVPAEAERDLRKVAKVSPRVAECTCELVERGRVKGRDLVENFGEVLCEVAEARFEHKPTMIDTRGARVSELIADPEQRTALTERYLAARPYEESEDPVIRFGEAEVDAARAAGCLIEHSVDHGGWTSTVSFVSDEALGADLAAQLVERVEKERAELAKLTSGPASAEPQENGDPEQLKEARREEREKAKRAAVRARGFNESLAANLLKRRGVKSRKAHGLNRAKALAAIVLEDNPQLAGAGLRLVLSQLQEVELKSLKSGESREKVSYADAEQCAEYLAKRIEGAGSAEEVLELLADALIAAELADERELPQSRRIGWFNRAQARVKKLLAEEIKEVRPSRRAGGSA